MTTFAQLSARLKNFLRGCLLVLGLKEGLVECATVCVKSVVILMNCITGCLRAKCTKQLCSGEDIYLGFCKYKRSYVFLRNPIFCLSNQFSLNLFLMRSQTDFIKAGTYFTKLSAHFVLILRFRSKNKCCNRNHLIPCSLNLVLHRYFKTCLFLFFNN